MMMSGFLLPMKAVEAKSLCSILPLISEKGERNDITDLS